MEVRIKFFKIPFLLFPFLTTALTAHEPLSLERPDGSTIAGYISLPKNANSYPVVIFLQGGERECLQEGHAHLEPFTQELGVALLTIEKPGNDSGDDEERDWKVFLEKNTVERRFFDHTIVVDALREGILEGWDGRIVWMGGSEGACLSAYLAPAFPETCALMIYAGCGSGSYTDVMSRRLFEKLRYNYDLAPLCFAADPISRGVFWGVQYLAGAMAREFDEEKFECFIENEELPTPFHVLSLCRMPPLTPFVAMTTCPVLCIHGTEDERIPVQYVDQMVAELQAQAGNRLTYWRMEGADHVEIYGDPYFGVRKGFKWLGQILQQVTL